MIVLDGGALFSTIAETERRLSRRADVTRVRPTVIIGVSHEGDGLYDPVQRHRDYTPGPASVDRETDLYQAGGAAAFLNFLVDEVLPLVGPEVPLDPRSRALLGHSLAGYFVLLAMTARPAAFANYGAISPSIWWDPDGLTQDLKTSGEDSPALYLAVGALEEGAGGAVRAQRRMVGAVADFAQRAKPFSRRLECEILPDENHASVAGVAGARFLRFCGQS